MATVERFEGAYGALYDAVLQRPALRRAVFGAIGSAHPIVELEQIADQVVEHAALGIVLDIPCGGGTMIPLLRRAGFAGSLVAADLAGSMVERTRRVGDQAALPFPLDVLRADAARLPLGDESVDAIVSINGLHVMPDPRAVLEQFARVLVPGGPAWIVTITTGGGLRNRALRRIGRAASVLPCDPAPRGELVELLADCGLPVEADLGGGTFAGFRVRRREP